MHYRALYLLILPFLFSACEEQSDLPHASMGIMVGELTPYSALVQVRLCSTEGLVERDVAGQEGTVIFSLEGGGKLKREIAEAQAGNDYIARVGFTELEPGTEYQCKTIITHKGKQKPGPTAEFRTLPGKQKDMPVKFVVVTGMNYAKFHGDDRIDLEQHLLENNTKLPEPYKGPDKALGYPALESILKQEPDFFVGTGDNVYYDTPDKPRAETVEELRQKWHEQWIQPRYKDLFAKVPTYWMVDDHDYRIDDGDNSGDYLPTVKEAQDMMLEQLPYSVHGDLDVLTYRTHRASKDLQIWFTENRMYRNDNADPETPEKSIWGAEQKAWLKETLLTSDAKFKLLISPTPMIGPDDKRKFDNHTNHGGFRPERDEFFAWLKEKGLDQKHFYIVCGDRHWQYHSVHPTGIQEFSCGALIDQNSRLGRKPGDPESTDPEGLVKQPYAQQERGGGFLQVSVAEGKLEFTWFDDLGEVLHTTGFGG